LYIIGEWNLRLGPLTMYYGEKVTCHSQNVGVGKRAGPFRISPHWQRIWPTHPVFLHGLNKLIRLRPGDLAGQTSWSVGLVLKEFQFLQKCNTIKLSST